MLKSGSNSDHRDLNSKSTHQSPSNQWRQEDRYLTGRKSPTSSRSEPKSVRPLEILKRPVSPVKPPKTKIRWTVEQINQLNPYTPGNLSCNNLEYPDIPAEIRIHVKSPNTTNNSPTTTTTNKIQAKPVSKTASTSKISRKPKMTDLKDKKVYVGVQSINVANNTTKSSISETVNEKKSEVVITEPMGVSADGLKSTHRRPAFYSEPTLQPFKFDSSPEEDSTINSEIAEDNSEEVDSQEKVEIKISDLKPKLHAYDGSPIIIVPFNYVDAVCSTFTSGLYGFDTESDCTNNELRIIQVYNGHSTYIFDTSALTLRANNMFIKFLNSKDRIKVGADIDGDVHKLRKYIQKAKFTSEAAKTMKYKFNINGVIDLQSLARTLGEKILALEKLALKYVPGFVANPSNLGKYLNPTDDQYIYAANDAVVSHKIYHPLIYGVPTADWMATTESGHREANKAYHNSLRCMIPSIAADDNVGVITGKSRLCDILGITLETTEEFSDPLYHQFEMTNNEMTNNEMTNNEMTNNEMTNNEMTTSDTFSSETISSETCTLASSPNSNSNASTNDSYIMSSEEEELVTDSLVTDSQLEKDSPEDLPAELSPQLTLSEQVTNEMITSIPKNKPTSAKKTTNKPTEKKKPNKKKAKKVVKSKTWEFDVEPVPPSKQINVKSTAKTPPVDPEIQKKLKEKLASLKDKRRGTGISNFKQMDNLESQINSLNDIISAVNGDLPETERTVKMNPVVKPKHPTKPFIQKTECTRKHCPDCQHDQDKTYNSFAKTLNELLPGCNSNSLSDTLQRISQVESGFSEGDYFIVITQLQESLKQLSIDTSANLESPDIRRVGEHQYLFPKTQVDLTKYVTNNVKFLLDKFPDATDRSIAANIFLNAAFELGDIAYEKDLRGQ